MDDTLKTEEKYFLSWHELERFLNMQFDEGNACLVTQREYGYLVEVYEWRDSL